MTIAKDSLTSSTFESDLLAAVMQHSMLKHPFYVAWSEGKLSKEILQEYAKQYYAHVRAFPTYVSAVHSHCDDLETRQMLLENLIEEEQGEEYHPELWLRFAESLGVTRDEVRNAELLPTTKNSVARLKQLTQSVDYREGLAALYAYETQIPAICESKIDGLKKHYGFAEPKHYEYFSVHMEADREHSAAERRMLGGYIDNQNFEPVRASVNRVLDALWEMLSGVCRRHAIAC